MILSKLSLQDDTAHSNVKTILRSCDTICLAVDIQIAKIDEFQKKVSKSLHIYDNALAGICDSIHKLTQLEHSAEYVRVVEDITNIRCNPSFTAHFSL